MKELHLLLLKLIFRKKYAKRYCYKVDSDVKVEAVSDTTDNTVEETKNEEYSRKQAACKLGISVSTLDRLIKKVMRDYYQGIIK